MSGLYVKLDVEYASDDKLIAAGPMAELLYVRGLAFCKRQMVDGIIKTNQLPAVALGIPSARKHADALVEHGAWEVVPGGWYVAAWLKRNKSAAEIADDREARRLASVEANHAQHHVGEGKRPSPKCELCRPKNGPKSAPKSEANRTRQRLQEEEPEPEPEPEEEPKGKPEPEPEPEHHRRPTRPTATTNAGTTNKDPRLETVYELLADRQIANAGTIPIAPDAYRGQVLNTLARQHGERIRSYLAARPNHPAQTCADALALDIA